MQILTRSAFVASAFLAVACCLNASAATADIPGATIAPPSASVQEAPFKLSTGLYDVSGGGLPSGPGLDVNLRYSYGGGNHVWLGYYRAPAMGFSQARAGWDAVYGVGPVRFLPSLQVASGGFVGGSLAAEAGTTWFAGGGLGQIAGCLAQALGPLGNLRQGDGTLRLRGTARIGESAGQMGTGKHRRAGLDEDAILHHGPIEDDHIVLDHLQRRQQFESHRSRHCVGVSRVSDTCMAIFQYEREQLLSIDWFVRRRRIGCAF